MTSNSFSKKIKNRLSIVLAVLSILCFSLFFVACNEATPPTVTTDPTYTYTETDDGLISNQSFTYGTADTKLENYPKTSPTGWSRSKDTTGASSSSKSGVINVSEDGWKELMKALYKDSYFLGFMKNKFNFDEDKVKAAIKNGDDSKEVSDDDIRDYVITEYFKNLKNPGKATDANDNNVYMLNNYRSKNDYGLGASQKITSSTSVTVNKGEYVKISVWVYTQFISGEMNANGDFGANIRLSNTFNSSSQKELIIKNINHEEWKQYTLYVKGDAVYNTTFTLALGLGYGEVEQTEGTAFFDEINIERMTADEFKAAQKTITVDSTRKLLYSGNDVLTIKADEIYSDYLYDMSLTNSITDAYVGANYYESISDDFSHGFTTTKTGDITSVTRFPSVSTASVSSGTADMPYGKTNVKTTIVELNKAGYTLTLDVSDDTFKVGAEKFALVTFFIKNELSKLGNTTITIDLFDQINSEDPVKRAAIATLSDANGEWTKCSVLVKNNFEDSADARSFHLEIVIGPTNVATTEMAKDYASGTVSISQPVIIIGNTFNEAEENDSLTDEQKEIAEHQYKLYKLFENTATGTSALYAGYTSDFIKEDEEDSTAESYDINVSKSELGAIARRPVAPDGFKGVVTNHIYLKEDGENITSDINTRLEGDSDGNYAGLVNTKGIYSGFDVKTALGFNDGDKNLQPIMIYNKTANHYGFIGNAKTISANAYAEISITVKVDSTAKAYIYLVDVSGKTKNVMEFVDFTVNTTGTDEVKDGKTYKAEDNKLFFVVDKNTPVNNDGWATVTFYVGAGANAKNFRVEIWNGGRDGAESTKSQGYVFFKSINVTTSGAFTEPADYNSSLSSGNPLSDMGVKAFDESTKLLYQRPLTDLEKKFNEEKADSTNVVAYAPKYVWVANDTVIYAIYNSIDVVETDPYATLTPETPDGTTTENGCTAQTDPSAFWLSFSSILLGAVLALAIIALIVKNVRRRRKANASDAKSHYTITSRVKPKKNTSKVIVEDEEAIEEIEEQVESEETSDDVTEESAAEQTLDSYVYGDVQDFGEEQKSETSDKE